MKEDDRLSKINNVHEHMFTLCITSNKMPQPPEFKTMQSTYNAIWGHNNENDQHDTSKHWSYHFFPTPNFFYSWTHPTYHMW